MDYFKFNPFVTRNSSDIGAVKESDTAAVNKILVENKNLRKRRFKVC